MPRRLRTIPIYLLLGALLNVAVAWGIVVAHGDVWHQSNPAAILHRGHEVFMVRTRNLGHAIMSGPHWETPWGDDPRPAWCRLYDAWWPAHILDDRDSSSMMVASGWPFLSMQAWRRNWDPFTWGVAIEPKDLFSWMVKTNGRATPVLIPLRPVAVNFALNTAFYAALLWCVFVAPRATRSTLRRRRGLCPRCAYPREDHAVCPECGTSHNPEMTEPPAHAAPPAFTRSAFFPVKPSQRCTITSQ